LVHRFGNTAQYDAAFARLQPETGYLFLAVCTLNYAQSLIGINVMGARNESDVQSPDQYLSYVVGSNQQVKLINTDTPVGRLNRSQRAYNNFLEYIPWALSNIVVSGWIFPFPVFAVTVAILFARVVYSRSYTREATSRGPWFGLSMTLMTLLDGFTLYSGLRLLSGK